VSELLTQVSAFTVFLAIAAVGFLFLLVSLVFGEVFDHFGDGDFDHDLGHGGPGFFSPRILSVFVTAFGGFGAIASFYGLSTLPSSAVGFASGIIFASIIYAFARFLHGQQASTNLQSGDVVGRSARVVVTIPRDGVGQIRCKIGEEMIDRIARSRDGQPIPENAVVRVEEAVGEVVIVARQ
jgi:membrane protein implicated in regulation of membrane protease activity